MRIKPDLKFADKFLDLKFVESTAILAHLDEQIKLRELSVDKRIKKEPLTTSQ